MVLSVFQLNEYVRKSLAADPMLRQLSIRGEISNFKRHSSGHLYFSLKDEQARIACVMFRQHAMFLKSMPQDGMRVVLRGQVSLFARDGQYQFYAEEMSRDGVGDLYLRFEALKRKLEQLGWFDPSIKKDIPSFPRVVGVVTSPTGAAVRDIIRVATGRYPGVRILLCPVKVQGEGAAEEIAQGIARLASRPETDVIIVGRGGGSIEDLWAFNEECVARAIYNCPAPVISAVGHETDFTIADFVADLRAATPSAAAMAAVPDGRELAMTLDGALSRLSSSTFWAIERVQKRLDLCKGRLQACSPGQRIAAQRQQVASLRRLLTQHVRGALEGAAQRLGTAQARLWALSPRQVLRRGYAYVTCGQRPLTRARDARLGQALRIVFQDGSADARVEQIEEADEEV